MYAFARWITIILAISFPIAEQFGILEKLTWLSVDYTQFILVILAAFMTFSILSADKVEKEIKEINTHLTESIDQTIRALDGVDVQYFDNSEQGFLFLEDCIKNARKSIDQASFAKTPNIPSRQLDDYLSAIKYAAQKRDILYRYTYGDNWPERGDRLRRISKTIKFFLAELALGDKSQIPMLNFAIFDDEILYVRYPNDRTAKEIYLSIKHKAIVELFKGYFETIWQASNKD